MFERIKYHFGKQKEKWQIHFLNTRSGMRLVDDGVYLRKYKDYSDYISHQYQRAKPTKDDLKNGFKDRVDFYYQDAEKLHLVKPGSTVLCLGARDGSEVEAFRKLGALAVGIDLVYDDKSQHVHFGDFHDIPYPDSVFDFIYTNTLSHAYDLSKVLSEIRRVLKPEKGVLISNLRRGVEEGTILNGRWSSLTWDSWERACELIEAEGFNMDFHQKSAKNKWFVTTVFRLAKPFHTKTRAPR